MSDQAVPTPAPVVVTQRYEDEINLNTTVSLSGLSPERAKNLVRQGKVPSAYKNELGRWRFSRAAVVDYFTKRPKHSRSASFVGDGKTTYTVRLSPAEVEVLQSAGIVLKVKPRQKSKKEREAAKAAQPQVTPGFPMDPLPSE